MNLEPEIQDFLLNIDDETYKFTVQFSDSKDNFSCDGCAIKTLCDKCYAFAKQEIGGFWIPSDGAICTCSRTIDNTVVYDFRKEVVQKSDKFIIHSMQDISIQRKKNDENYNSEEDNTITPLSIINSFCLSGFCPIRTSTMDCIKSIECPFREIFKETEVEILYLPEK